MNLNAEKVGKAVKTLSWSGFSVLCIIDAAVPGGGLGLEQLAVNMLFAVLVLMLRPDGGGQAGISVLQTALAFCICAACAVSPDRRAGEGGVSLHAVLPILATVILTQVDISVRTSCKYRNVRSLFKSTQVLCNITEHARMQRCMALYMVCILLLTASSAASPVASGILRAVSVAVLAFLFVLEMAPASRFVFMDRHKYMQVSAMAKGKLKDNFVPEEMEGKDMGQTYRKAQDCMEKSQPYLNPDLSLEDMARMIGTNKVYLSRTINIVSGRNFCQFVNYYRVQYAKEMMLKDTHCKMIEVAMASGFHSVVTFNMAFKVNEELTPSEWLREYRAC